MSDGDSVAACSEAPCNSEPLVHTSSGMVQVEMSGLPPADSYARSDAGSTGEAESLIVAQCFEVSEQADRKWRAFNDVFLVRPPSLSRGVY